jgi:hypothetical protein
VRPGIRKPLQAPSLPNRLGIPVFWRQVQTLRSLRRNEARRAPRKASRLVFLTVLAIAAALGARQSLSTSAWRLPDVSSQAAPLETVWLIAVLLAAWFGFRTLDLVFRTDNAHALRHYPLSGWATGLDRMLRQWAEIAWLLMIPLVWMLTHFAVRPTSGAALALAMSVCSLPVISAGSIAGVVLPGYVAAMSGESSGSAAAAQRATASLYRVVPGVGVGITAALLLLLKLGFEEPIRMGGYTGRLIWARSFQVGVAVPLVLSAVTLGYALMLWSQHHAKMSSAFEDADGMVDVRERVAESGHIWPSDRTAIAVAVRRLVLSRQQPWAFGMAVGVTVVSAIASFGSSLDSYRLTFSLMPAAVTGVWLHPGAPLKTLRPAFEYLAPGFLDDRRAETSVVRNEYVRRMMPATFCAMLASPSGWHLVAPTLTVGLFLFVHQTWVRRVFRHYATLSSGVSV